MKLLVILLYFIIIILIGIFTTKKVKTSKDFALGGRKLNPISTALGAGAADMSGWIMMALPGAVLLNGIQEIWLPIGLSIGAYLNWQFIARRIRVNTKKYGDSITISSYLSNRFNDNSKILKITVSIITTIFFIIYIASALVALSFLIETYTKFNYLFCLIFSSAFVLLYTSLGGLTTINKIDVIQGTLMLFSLLLVPITIIFKYDFNNINNINLNITNPFSNLNYISIISLLSWGLGYFGQPHILVRFMAIDKSKTLNISKNICMSWMILSLIGSFFIGLFGRLLFTDINNINPETIFLLSADALFPNWLSGVILAAVISAIMSTISAQLHATSCSLTENFSIKILNKLNKVWIIRIIMFFIIFISATYASNPQNTVLQLVSLAWAGLGSAFGPTILFSLYSKKMNKLSALCGIFSGGFTVIVWHALKSYGGIFNLYEIIPGFSISCLTIFIFNHFTCKN